MIAKEIKTQFLYRIKNLTCQYPNNTEPVLFIPELNLRKNGITFLLGTSGSGKSTFLEALAQMNNIIKAGSEMRFKPKVEEFIFSNSNASLDIEDVRNKHFSFIFQQNDLLEHFTVYENIALPAQVQNPELTDEEVNEKIDSLISSLMYETKGKENKAGRKIDKETKVKELSGGQKQRIAFARAICKNYSVLFGDEPTGNLDEFNAENLLRVLKEDVRNREASAIIVSHSIDLALNFANYIILLTKEDIDGFPNEIGTVKRGNSFVRKSKSVWEDSLGKQYNRKELYSNLSYQLNPSN